MLIQRLNRTDAEKVFIIVDNGEAATLPTGAAVIWQTTTDANGVQVRQPDAAKLFAFVGCLDTSMASVTGTYTLCQIFGYDTDAIVIQTDTSQAAGLELVPVDAKNYLQTVATTTASNAAVTQQPIYAVLAESIASSSATATKAVKIYLRAM